jgi:hypothetical protein
MKELLDRPPYDDRDDAAFLDEMNKLNEHHLKGCETYRRIWPEWRAEADLSSMPYLHVGVFKHVKLRTQAEGLKFERTLRSSSTTGKAASQIPLDTRSSSLQAASSAAILRDFLGKSKRPLLVVDNSRSLVDRSGISARVAAAMSLRPLASDMSFLLGDSLDPSSMQWDRLRCMLEQHESLIVYGFTWILWLAWGAVEKPDEIKELLAGKTIHFVHSGGWKKLESIKVDRKQFDSALLCGLSKDSGVLDYYGLVEQVGIIYPLCPCGARHVPGWAGVLVRDPWTLEVLPCGETGMLQLMNTLAWGAPYHSVLTEDLGRLVDGECTEGRAGPRFELVGRVPRAEMRGCANV